ncbi:protein TolR [Gammaproteobacteria bacterium]|nr:protein TolR [Gammaproteobacteria bacterium]
MRKVYRRKPMSEINVVPYIDVMLVLLVIFMVTAPLMTQGIKVELPEATSEPVTIRDEFETLIVSVRRDGSIYINIGQKSLSTTLEEVAEAAKKILDANPNVKVLIEGDKTLPYGKIVGVMEVLRQSGASGVGLITQPPQE